MRREGCLHFNISVLHYLTRVEGGRMTDQELLLAISDMMDSKLKAELQPVKNECRM